MYNSWAGFPTESNGNACVAMQFSWLDATLLLSAVTLVDNNLRTKTWKCIHCTNEKKWRKKWCISKEPLPVHQKWFNELNCSSQTMHPFASQYLHAFRLPFTMVEQCHPWSFASRVVWEFWNRVPLFVYTVCITSMILCTAGFLHDIHN